MTDYYSVEPGDIVRFVKGKKNRNVSYTLTGKVILCKHQIQIGYAKIKTVENNEKYFLVTAEHVVHDLYPEISYEEFLEVIEKHGYKIGFDRRFKRRKLSENDISTNEHQVFAYNSTISTCIVATTVTIEGDEQHFNYINIYLPFATISDFRRNHLFNNGNSVMVVLDAVRTTYSLLLYPLDYIKTYMENRVLRKFDGHIPWHKDERPSFICYDDNISSENEYLDLFYERMALATNDALEMFKGCDFIKKLESRRNEHAKLGKQ